MTSPEHQHRPDNSHNPDDPGYIDWGNPGWPQEEYEWGDFEWDDFDGAAAVSQPDQWRDWDDPTSDADPDIDPDGPDQSQTNQDDGIEYFDPDTFVANDSPEQGHRRRVLRVARKLLGRIDNSPAAQAERVLAARRDRSEQDILRPAESMIVDDKEILGKSEFVNLQVQQAQHDIINYKATTELRDSLVTPRKNYVDWRRKRIQIKVDRLQRKVDASPDTRWNRHRKKTLDMFKNRVEWRKGQLNKYAESKTKRAEVLSGRIDKRNVQLQKEIDHVINKKIEAQRRKVERTMYKNDKGHTFSSFVIHPIERTNYMNSLTAAQRQEITKQAILNIREKNIKKGRLDVSHAVDPNTESREVNDYELAA